MNRRIAKSVKRWKSLRRDNGIWKVVCFYANDLAGKRRHVTFRLYGVDITVRTSTTDLTVALTSLGGEFNTLRTCFPEEFSGLIVDAGGYIGTAAIALSRMYPRATVVTIEPSSDNFAVLSRNVAGHGNIHALNAALMPNGFVGEVELLNRGTGNWGFTVIEKPQDRDAVHLERVASITLQDLLDRFDYQSIGILKMDIEGGEYALFRQDDWLHRTDVLMIELHERIVPGCVAQFKQAVEGRFTYKDAGEKFVSVGKGFFR